MWGQFRHHLGIIFKDQDLRYPGMGCARGLGLGDQQVLDNSSLKWCYILSSGVARILVWGAFNLILFKNILNILKY